MDDEAGGPGAAASVGLTLPSGVGTALVLPGVLVRVFTTSSNPLDFAGPAPRLTRVNSSCRICSKSRLTILALPLPLQFQDQERFCVPRRHILRPTLP